MKDIKRLERILLVLERVNLTLLTLCLSLPFALLFSEDRVSVRLLWGLGTLIPVHLICAICLRVKKKLRRYLLCALVLALALALPDNTMRRFFYGVCCAPILISGLWIQRPRGKLVLTVPKLYHPVAALLVFSMGKIARLPLLSGAGIALVALLTLVACFYYNQDKLLYTLRDVYQTEISRRSIIAVNRRVTVGFLLLSVLILAAVPFLIRQQEQTPVPIAAATETMTESTTTEETEPTFESVTVTDRSETTYNYDAAGTVLRYVLIAILAAVLLLAVFAIVSAIRSVIGSTPKHSERDEETDWQIERLESTAPDRHEENAAGYEKKLRRRYQKLIRSRTEQGTRLNSMTPAELGEAADLQGPAAETVRELYEQTRYGPEPVTKERYTQFKQAVHSLPPSGKKPEEKKTKSDG